MFWWVLDNLKISFDTIKIKFKINNFDYVINTSINQNYVKIIEDFSEFEDEAVGEVELQVDDTMTLLREYINNTVTDLDKDRLTSVMQTLYVEAQHELW